ncbi:MAG: helix-turn-helix transcriptional regulator [Erythrobacter sp.]|nr:helix-turn-helix transcriptional regulator [Erythrobacter sp.]
MLVTGIPALMAAIMVLMNAREALASRFFLAVVFAWVWHTGPYIIGFSGAYQAYPWLTFFPFNTELWIGPLWLLTVRALTSDALPERWWLWLVPGMVQTAYYTACFLLIGPEWGTGEGAAAMKFAFNDAYHVPYFLPVETVVGLSLMGFAAWDSWRRIARYRVWIGEEHSNAERVDLLWLQQASGAIAGLALMWVVVDAVASAVGGLSYPTNFYFYAVSGAVVLWLSFQFLARSDRRFPKPHAPSQTSETQAEAPALEQEPIAPRFSLDLLEAKVREGGWHFDQDLTLGELARRLGTNASTLSASLNAREEVNFTIFINGLRVEAVCEQLRASAVGADSSAPNLLDLALDCGFGSKATFNRAFKRHTGLPPRDWMQANLKPQAA